MLGIVKNIQIEHPKYLGEYWNYALNSCRSNGSQTFFTNRNLCTSIFGGFTKPTMETKNECVSQKNFKYREVGERNRSRMSSPKILADVFPKCWINAGITLGVS